MNTKQIEARKKFLKILRKLRLPWQFRHWMAEKLLD